ncbi:MAG: putative selenium-dependent hydroxylase accessory protein YqeC, partial [Holdemanella sp.]|nr:putative selenium-dependent hydroxylase accessory protein YqeC [Holdemanella sp.]
MIIAYIGSGGKTTAIKKKAQELISMKKKVLIVTSTHMAKEENTLVSVDVKEIKEALLKQDCLMVGSDCDDKIGPVPMDVYYEICPLADYVLIEADGSKRLPIKYPNENEPVIYDNVDEIVLVTGLNAIGKKFKDVCHRYALYNKDGNETVKAEHIQELIHIYKEKLKDKKMTVYPTHVDSLYTRVIGKLLEKNLDVNLVDVNWFEEKPTLFICGAGHVSTSLVEIASHLDFHIKVMDDRKEFADRHRFPSGVEVIYDSFDNLNAYLVNHAYYVVLTRGHKDDYECVKRILATDYTYLGMIGSKKKVIKTLEQLKKDGFEEEKLVSIHAPIGLDIKAQTPSEIGISILAQIIQVKNSKFASSISHELLHTDKNGVLCIVIDKKGSAPRGVGSMMLVGKDFTLDTIGGGEVEARVIEDARALKEDYSIKEYILDNERSRALGMICGGTQKILLLNELSVRNPLPQLKQVGVKHRFID